MSDFPFPYYKLLFKREVQLLASILVLSPLRLSKTPSNFSTHAFSDIPVEGQS